MVTVLVFRFLSRTFSRMILWSMKFESILRAYNAIGMSPRHLNVLRRLSVTWKLHFGGTTPQIPVVTSKKRTQKLLSERTSTPPVPQLSPLSVSSKGP